MFTDMKPERLWEQIEESIIEVFTAKESQLVQSATNYKSNRNFFEMMRFDFVVDENFNIYLMEVSVFIYKLALESNFKHFKPLKTWYHLKTTWHKLQ